MTHNAARGNPYIGHTERKANKKTQEKAPPQKPPPLPALPDPHPDQPRIVAGTLTRCRDNITVISKPFV